MKTFSITEKQLQEIAGRLNGLPVTGNLETINKAQLLMLLEEIAKQELAEDDNVVDLKRADAVT